MQLHLFKLDAFRKHWLVSNIYRISFLCCHSSQPFPNCGVARDDTITVTLSSGLFHQPIHEFSGITFRISFSIRRDLIKCIINVCFMKKHSNLCNDISQEGVSGRQCPEYKDTPSVILLLNSHISHWFHQFRCFKMCHAFLGAQPMFSAFMIIMFIRMRRPRKRKHFSSLDVELLVCLSQKHTPLNAVSVM